MMIGSFERADTRIADSEAEIQIQLANTHSNKCCVHFFYWADVQLKCNNLASAMRSSFEELV